MGAEEVHFLGEEKVAIPSGFEPETYCLEGSDPEMLQVRNGLI